ncbi:hypothetical protein [Mesoflavibacter sp. SCSIO 43206]|uniref:hypothetical protein n=1 Tax=Mesoflavibacter sp. SCSIO 43206 TaxID=2779362 RepID=UPI001CA8BAD6|nr:hypothetical protein [Mesoflavibacter sp. SCSIO 43206]UAB75963.1 hypothetical protein INR78_02975 [Mesoflavibacter sp. SCSIO 43206]
MSSNLERNRLDVLLKEYELVNYKIEKFVGNQFLYTQGALALTAGYIFFLVEGIGLVDNSIDQVNTKLYLQFLPVLVLMILAAILYQYQRTLGFHGYKQYLEIQINTLINQNLITYSHIGGKYMIKNYVIYLNLLMYMVIYVGAVTIAFNKPDGIENPNYLIAHVIIFLIFLIFAWFQTKDQLIRVKNMAFDLSESELLDKNTEFN